MKNLLKTKLEDIVALLNNPDTVVLEKEIKEKLEKIVLLLDGRESIVRETEMNEKLDKVVAKVSNAMADPDIDIEFCEPNADDPYILVTYVVSAYNKPTRKIRLGSTALRGTAEETANQITFSIEEFKSEIDSVEMG
ncbi:hypothetical protein N9A28_07655 [Sulfurimonas sp.]|nr:hypothetical protein [Sulfurimonas sp.]